MGDGPLDFGDVDTVRPTGSGQLRGSVEFPRGVVQLVLDETDRNVGGFFLANIFAN
jgi:DNA polymerase II small subunit/DNA polymerase delta subunit B